MHSSALDLHAFQHICFFNCLYWLFPLHVRYRNSLENKTIFFLLLSNSTNWDFKSSRNSSNLITHISGDLILPIYSTVLFPCTFIPKNKSVLLEKTMKKNAPTVLFFFLNLEMYNLPCGADYKCFEYSL